MHARLLCLLFTVVAVAQPLSEMKCTSSRPEDDPVCWGFSADRKVASPGFPINYNFTFFCGGRGASNVTFNTILPNLLVPVRSDSVSSITWTCSSLGISSTPCADASGLGNFQHFYDNCTAGTTLTYTITAVVAPLSLAPRESFFVIITPNLTGITSSNICQKTIVP